MKNKQKKDLYIVLVNESAVRDAQVAMFDVTAEDNPDNWGDVNKPLYIGTHFGTAESAAAQAANRMGIPAANVIVESLTALVARELKRAEEKGESTDTHPNGDRECICPVCGAPITYENRELVDGDEFACDWTCENCGSYGKSAEIAMFREHYNVYTADGKRYLKNRDEGIDGYYR